MKYLNILSLVPALSLVQVQTSTFTAAEKNAHNVCPGSPAWQHASCRMTIRFPSATCSIVAAEIRARLTDEHWIDPHNRGTYTRLNDTGKNSDSGDDGATIVIQGKRLTGKQNYTDLFAFSLSSDGASSCNVQACSESQVFSILDFSTNYCNLRNLYCNAGDGCVGLVTDDLEYEEEYTKCRQNKKSDCIVRVETEKETELGL